MSNYINAVLEKQAIRVGRALVDVDILQSQLEEAREQIKALTEEVQRLQQSEHGSEAS